MKKYFPVTFDNISVLFIILLHLISSSLHTRLLHIPYAYVSIDSIDRSLLSLFELKAILLISLVKTLFFSHLTLCCVFNTSLLFFYKFLLIFLKIIYVNFIFSRRFILFSSWVASKQFIQFSTLIFLFMAHFFAPFAFLSSLPSSIK